MISEVVGRGSVSEKDYIWQNIQFQDGMIVDGRDGWEHRDANRSW